MMSFLKVAEKEKWQMALITRRSDSTLQTTTSSAFIFSRAYIQTMCREFWKTSKLVSNQTWSLSTLPYGTYPGMRYHASMPVSLKGVWWDSYTHDFLCCRLRYGRCWEPDYLQNLTTFFEKLRTIIPDEALVIWNLAMPLGKTIIGGFLVPEVKHFVVVHCEISLCSHKHIWIILTKFRVAL